MVVPVRQNICLPKFGFGPMNFGFSFVLPNFGFDEVGIREIMFCFQSHSWNSI